MYVLVFFRGFSNKVFPHHARHYFKDNYNNDDNTVDDSSNHLHMVEFYI